MTDDASRICAIVVSYQPPTSTLGEALAALRPQVNELVVVDNGSSQQTLEWLRSRSVQLSFDVVSLGRNTGVASALNEGVAWARQHGCAYVLMMDQDSIPQPDMVARLASAHRQLTEAGARVAAVGPRYIDPVMGHTSSFVRFGRLTFQRVRCSPERANEPVAADFLITSGSLVSMATIDEVGCLDDELFIDHVDTEWFLRARQRGYRAFGVWDAIMHHSLGTQTIRLWLGRWRFVPVHSPLRHYYTFRNSLRLFRRPYAPVRWIVNDTVRLGFMFFFFSLFVPPRLQHLKMMLRGLRDGLITARRGNGRCC
jgi:rhamnosyltransferase